MPDFLDRLGDELLRAAAAPIPAPAAATPRPDAVARRRRLSRRRVLAIVLLLLAAGAAAIAIATRGRPSPGPVPPRPGAALTLAPDAAQRDGFAIMRRASTPADAIPERLPIALSGASGADLGQARLAPPAGAARVWVIPGRGSVCLLSRWAAERASGAACARDADALAGRLLVTTGADATPGVEHLAGLVPDGVARVTVLLDGGAAQRVEVREGVYALALRGRAREVRFRRSGGSERGVATGGLPGP